MNKFIIEKKSILSFLFFLSFFAVANEIETPIGTLRGIVLGSFFYFLFFFKDKLASKGLFKFFTFIFLYSIITVLYTGFFSIKMFSQIIFIMLGSLFMYMLFKQLGIYKIYDLYIKLAMIISILILVQVIGYHLDISFLYDYSYIIHTYRVPISASGDLRPSSFFPEPATITYINSLATVMSIYSLIFKKKVGMFLIPRVKALFIISAFLLTYSSLGYIVIILALISCFRISIKIITISIIISCAMFFFLINNASFMFRVDGVMSLFNGHSLSVSSMNLSVWAIFSNLVIAWHNFLEYFPFGVGIANHPLSFDAFSDILSFVKNDSHTILNKQNAGGLFIRILSEFGMIGISWIVFFIAYFKIKRRENVSFYYLSNGFLIGIIIILFRHGAYISTMTIFYMIGYYYLSKINGVKISK